MKTVNADNTPNEFRSQKKDLIFIAAIMIVILSSMALLKIMDKENGFIGKISEKIGSKYIK